MQQYSYSLNLQAREEPFGMVLIEAMKAGCIVIASPVGAFPEIIQHGSNGFFIAGEHASESTQLEAAALILELVGKPNTCSTIRDTAMDFPLDWNTIAKVWTGHWDWELRKRLRVNKQHFGRTCASCGTIMVSLFDGFHCIGCGLFERILAS
jgi:glycosyltransferase involved in cell wall biosynthesis